MVVRGTTAVGTDGAPTGRRRGCGICFRNNLIQSKERERVNMEKVIYVDFENVPNVEIQETSDTRILLFIGQSQKRLSTSIVRAIQPLLIESWQS